MAKFYAELTPALCEFIGRQHMFFTATAGPAGRINLSPKGLDSFRILNVSRVAYLDLTGSGNETAAHLKRDGRITFMFCSFDATPLILRLYGQGRAIQPRQQEWAALRAHFPPLPGARQIIVADIASAQTSCGYGVPRYDFHAQRDTLAQWAEKKGPQGLEAYWHDKNQRSVDGLPTGLLGD
ncbi:MAG: pyridoxamine 5'-phosphate oxidase family protein [Betaproteobacteria bacterium]|nr:pyridoxamine 5'-phosphate oxidase family protein [Betaproteobacteria bacterium]